MNDSLDPEKQFLNEKRFCHKKDNHIMFPPYITHSAGSCIHKQKSMPKGYSFLRLDQIYYYFLMYSFGFPFSCPPTTLYVHEHINLGE